MPSPPPPTPIPYDPTVEPPGGWLRRLWYRRAPWLLLTGGLLLVTAVLTLLQPFPRVDRMLQDNARAAMGQSHSGEVVVVAIDDASLAAVGRWPWRRALHAEVLRRIAAQSPRCIGLDLLLTEQDGADPLDDEVLAHAIRDSGCVVLPMALQSAGSAAQKELVPLPGLAEAAAGIGHAHISLDQDGVARSVYLSEGFADRPWPHFVSALHQAGEAWARGGTLPAHPVLPAPASAVRGPWERSEHELIVFTYADQPFTTVSYVDVLRGKVPPALFKDRYVLVGATALGLGDAYATAAPSETGLAPGVVIFANVLQGLLSGHRVVVASPWQDLAFNVLPLAVALLGLLWLRPAGVLLLIGSMLALRLGLHVARPWVGVQFAPAVGFMALLLVYPLWSLTRLTAALRFLHTGTQQLNSEFEGFPTPAVPEHGGDFLERQMAATAAAALRLRNLHRFVRDGIDHLPDATLVLDDRARVLIANLAALRHWQAEDTGLVGRDVHALLGGIKRRSTGTPMFPSGRLRQSIEPVLDEGEDDQGCILLVRCVPFYDTSNAHAGWMVALVNITSVRRAQSQRDDALRFISHDIREPMASILTILELARTRPEQFDRETVFSRIERHALAGLELADGFVNVARAEVQPFDAGPVDLVALMQEAADDCWIAARKLKVQVLLGPVPPEALFIGDRSLLGRALVNVLSNALKYSPEGSEVRCSLVARGPHWALSVRDEGPGIPPGLQSQLFQPFQRLHRETHPQVQGVGLGLLLVRAAVQRHGGTIEIESAAGTGCTVTLVLPRPTDAQLAAFPVDME